VGDELMRLQGQEFIPVDVKTLRNLIGDFYQTMAYGYQKSQVKLVNKKMSDDNAGMLLKAEARFKIPHVDIISRCPIYTNTGIQTSGVHGNVLVAGKEIERVESLPEAVELINSLIAEYEFCSLADKSRALSMIIAPALKFGGLFTDRTPIFVVEADQSQAGKGYIVVSVSKIYRGTVANVTNRTGGVGSIDESLDMAMVKGSAFICWDNVRGRIDSQRLESLVTTTDYIEARIPHVGYCKVKPSAHVWLFTANSIEATHDIMNRSMVISIRKKPSDYVFNEWEGKGILGWIEHNQPRILGAIFRIVEEWEKAGKPVASCPFHDFRKFAGVMAWICDKVFGLPAPSEGHLSASTLRANPTTGWLHKIAEPLVKAGKNEDLTAQDLLDLSSEFSVDAPYSDVKALGRALGKVFIGDICRIEDFEWTRTIERDYSRNFGSDANQKFEQKRYSVVNLAKIEPVSEPINE
jgi:hypothetical protein